MGRQPCCDKIGLKRGPWSIDEDQKLMKFILDNGIQCWRHVPKLAGLLRCGKSCRLRWINYLRPDLKRGAFSEADEDQIIQLHSCFGNRWSKIAAHFSGRTDNEIKNHWNTKIKKKLKLLGLDPQTHKPIEHHEDCDAKEKTLHSKSMEELVDDLERKLLDDSGSEKNQMPWSKNGIEKSGSAEDANFVHNNEMSWENSDVGSTVTPQTDPSNTFSSVTEESLPDEVFFQQWIDNVDSMLLWDGF